MKVDLTEAQLKRLIELVSKATMSKTDRDLIEYLKQYQMPEPVAYIDLDEIPF
jgi:replication initiation and membrane attachment protein DnaB